MVSFCYSFLIGLLSSFTYNAHPFSELPSLEKSSPFNTVFVFDFHGVIATESALGMVKKGIATFKRHPKKMTLLKQLCSFGFNRITKNHPQCLAIEYAMTYSEHDMRINNTTLDLINPHVIDVAMIDQIKRLKREGYAIFLCSNLGIKSYERYVQDNQDLADLFLGIYLSGEHNEYLTKKSPLFFTFCKEKIDQLCRQNGRIEPTTIVIVDDSRSNLNRAKAAHKEYHGVYFTGVKMFSHMLDSWGISS